MEAGVVTGLVEVGVELLDKLLGGVVAFGGLLEEGKGGDGLGVKVSALEDLDHLRFSLRQRGSNST